MKLIGTIWGIVSILITALAFIPFFGWLNWATIPFALVGLVASALVDSEDGRLLCGASLVIGIIRLYLGGGLL